jgi:hemoglobin
MSPSSVVTESALAELVSRFYAKVRQDAEIGPLFNAAVHDWDEHLLKLADFWSSVMLTSGRYKGNPVAAHLKHAIMPEMFDRWLAIWTETVREQFSGEAAEELLLKAHRIGESLKLALFYRPARRATPASPGSIASR